MSLFLATVLVGALMAFVGVCFLFKEIPSVAECCDSYDGDWGKLVFMEGFTFRNS